MSVEAPERRTDAGRFPTEEEFQELLQSRHRKGLAAKLAFLLALSVGVLALLTLLYTIINDSFGLVAVVNERDPEEIVASLGYDPETTSLEQISREEQLGLLQETLSSGVGRRLEREQRFLSDGFLFEDPDVYAELCASDEPVEGCTAGIRSDADVFAIVEERVVVPDVIASEELVPSLLNPEGFRQEILTAFEESPQRFGDYTVDQARFEWRAWLDIDFLQRPNNSTPELAGVRTAILGSAWLMIITLLFSVPIGVGAAIYLVEFARPTRFNEFIQTNINNLAGVPSVIYGMLGLAVLVRTFEPFTSGSLFLDEGATGNGRTIMAGGITLGLLILPVVIISAQEALRSVPNSLRQAGMGLGATRWQTVRSQVLPVALPGILTGTILALARAIGETAPLIVVGASGFFTADPSGPFSNYTAMPIQIFQWTGFPQEEFRNIAAAAIIVLLVLLLVLNGTAVFLRNKYSRRA